jgi:hypothetical protein
MALIRSKQAPRLEGLGQIVVGARFEPLDAVVGFAFRRQQQDRCLAGFAQRPGQADPVLARHHHVEHDQIEIEPFEHAARMGGVARRGDQEPVPLQKLLAAGRGCVRHHRRSADARRFRSCRAIPQPA